MAIVNIPLVKVHSRCFRSSQTDQSRIALQQRCARTFVEDWHARNKKGIPLFAERTDWSTLFYWAQNCATSTPTVNHAPEWNNCTFIRLLVIVAWWIQVVWYVVMNQLTRKTFVVNSSANEVAMIFETVIFLIERCRSWNLPVQHLRQCVFNAWMGIWTPRSFWLSDGNRMWRSRPLIWCSKMRFGRDKRLMTVGGGCDDDGDRWWWLLW